MTNLKKLSIALSIALIASPALANSNARTDAEIKRVASVGDRILNNKIDALRSANVHRNNAQDRAISTHWYMIQDEKAKNSAQDNAIASLSSSVTKNGRRISALERRMDKFEAGISNAIAMQGLTDNMLSVAVGGYDGAASFAFGSVIPVATLMADNGYSGPKNLKIKTAGSISIQTGDTSASFGVGFDF